MLKKYIIDGSVQGLITNGLILSHNNSDNITLKPGDTTFTFQQEVAYDSSYIVSIRQQPSGQTCSITANAAGNKVHENVNNVSIVCAAMAAKLYVQVTGLDASQQDALIIQNNNDAERSQTLTENNDCGPSLAARSSCTLTFSSIDQAENDSIITIQGDNTNVIKLNVFVSSQPSIHLENPQSNTITVGNRPS